MLKRAALHPYYAAEFAAIAAGGGARLNTAALLGGPFFLLYRGCWARCMKLYGAFLLGAALAAASFFLRLPYALWTALTGLSTTVPPGAPLAMLAMALAVWGVGLNIYSANTFNRAYFAYCGGDARVPASAMAAALLALVLATLAVAGLAHTGGLLARGLSDWLLYGFPIPAQSPDPGFFARF